MLNDAFVLEQATHFAERVHAMVGNGSPAKHIELAFRIALGRNPTAREAAWSEALLAEHAAENSETKPAVESLSPQALSAQALSHLCHMLLSTNEFLYVQ